MKTLFSRVGRVVAGAVLAVSLLSPSRAAADFFYHFNNAFSGVAPSNPAPWVDAFFHDVSPGTVNLTVSAVGLASGEFLSEFYINLNPADAPTSLVFTLLGSSGGFTLPVIAEGVDSFKADGDGKYDVHFAFATPSGSRFEAGDFITYRITGISGLTALDFNYLSAPAGGHGPFLAAGHVQGICMGDSGWISPTGLTPVPEPAPGVLFGLALSLWAGSRRLFVRQKKA